jgi:molybdopterin-containing oxidoreductase family membrane subunit
MNKKNFKILVVAAIVGLGLGTIGLGNFLIFGKKTLNLGSYVPWGLWVALYLFFLGLTAGAFLITILTYVFRVKAFASIGPLSAFTVLVVLICEIIIIGLDLGHMFRAYRFFVTPNLSSMMFWMVLATLAMVAIYFLECFYLFRESLVAWSQEPGRPGQGFYRFLARGKLSYDQTDRERDQQRVHRLSLLSLPVGALFYGINGAIFGVLLDRPLWNTMTPLIFILTALLAGGALITLLTYLFQPEDEPIVRQIEKVLGEPLERRRLADFNYGGFVPETALKFSGNGNGNGNGRANGSRNGKARTRQVSPQEHARRTSHPAPRSSAPSRSRSAH